MISRAAFALALLMCASGFAFAQLAATPVKDTTAVQLARTALNAMSPSIAVNDISLSAQVARSGGSNSDLGAATLEALVSGEASVTYSLSVERHAEIINPSADPRGAWSSADGVWHRMALHNTWTPAAWFAPALILEEALGDQQLALESLGSTNLNGEPVQHLRSWRVLPPISGSAGDLALIQTLSMIDIYLDTASGLPVEFDFNIHPDSNAGTNIPIAIRFSNWQKTSGALIPYHIQRFFNGGLLDDISVSSANVNSGLSSSSFDVPATTGGAQ